MICFSKKTNGKERMKKEMSLREKFALGKQKTARLVADGITVTEQAMASVTPKKKAKITNKVMKAYNIIVMAIMTVTMVGMCFATDPAATVINNMIDIICKVFKYVGVVLGVYSVGQLVMAFKNEDADSKSRATTMLVVAGILVGIETLVTNTGLKDYLN